MWFLIALIWFALIVGIVWHYQRKQRERAAEQEKRFAQFFGAELSASSAKPALNPAPPTEMPALTSTPMPASVAYARKPRLFPQRHALLYYLLRTGLPDHEIFADHALADFIEVTGGDHHNDRAPALRQLAAHRADFVVCNKQMEVIAAVIVTNAGISAPVRAALQAADVRLVLVHPEHFPKHTEVRALIYH